MGDESRKDTRRSFLGKAVAGGLALSLPILNNRTARAGEYEDCLADCYTDYTLCCFAASTLPWYAQTAGRIACESALYACYAACAAQRMLRGAQAGAQWILDHPGAVVGTIVVIGGVALIVSTGPGGLILLPFAL